MKTLIKYFKEASPSVILVNGYLFFLFIAWGLLSLPVSQQVPLNWEDVFFIAASAVSTTGLISIDPGSSFSFFGELVILIIIQVGGIGYMTFGSLILVSLKNKMSKESLKSSLEINRREFALPADFKTSSFVKHVVVFKLAIEAIGACVLYIFFFQSNIENPAWSAIFHSISAFCTAGFSLMSTNFVAFQSHIGVNVAISILSILGCIGFIVFVDLWSILRDRSKELHFTSKIILKVTFFTLIVGTVFLAFADEKLSVLPAKEQWLIAFFQVMTASTTVGFNTYAVADFNLAIIFVLYFLMLFGAAPSGTGGGLKSTTLAALIGIVRSTLKRRDKVSIDNKNLPLQKLQIATSSFIFALFIFFIAVVSLLITETAPIEWIMFEVLSALGTVGLSMGLTSELSLIGKLIIVLLMFVGRVGILTFGIVLSLQEERHEQADEEDDIAV
uniref:TrkH family potassium uptake protein n=1 Tax=Ningiella ruwaisensis TaxID=2364274 RepID=UPI001F4F8639|nr:potassium transporter TrkG [Ningiella ruwaisensis]